MLAKNQDNIRTVVQRGLLFGVLVGLALVLLGWILTPAANLLSIAAACAALVIYGLVFIFGLPKLHPEILRWAAIFGLIAGVIFAGEILLEYALLPKDISRWGLVEFGLVFFLYFLSSLWVSYRNKQVKPGLLAAIISAMLGALIWAIVLLAVFYIFRGTERQVQVFTAEGNYQDFASSGLTDFNAFIMEDFCGAIFFHFLLSLVVATVLGFIGAVLGKVAARFQ